MEIDIRKLAGDNLGEPMKYPYTMTAKIVHVPYKLLWKNGWLLRYFMYGSLITLPVMWQIQQLSYNPENVKKWAEIRRKQFSGEDH